MKILIIDDDEYLAKSLSEDFTKQNYIVDVATDGQIGWEQAKGTDYDLIILDVKPPKIDGINLCKQLRSQQCSTPILLLTACGQTTEKILGLDAGADDCVVKPINVEELKARMRVLLRRPKVISSVLKWGNLYLDANNYQFIYQGKPLHLTPIEFNILELFLHNPERVFTCSSISKKLSPFETPLDSVVKELLQGLFTKLKAANADLIEIVYGIGYRLKPLLDRQTAGERTSTTSNPQLTTEVQTQPLQQQTLTALAGIWERYQESLLKRVSVLEQAAITLLQQSSLDEQQRQKAERYAHSLAGSLGTFGYMQASMIARQIEQILHTPVPSLTQKQVLFLNQLIVDLHQELDRQPIAKTPDRIPRDTRPHILIIDDDLELTQRLALEAQARQMRTSLAANFKAARDAIAQERPDLILLDLSFADATEHGLTLLAELNSHQLNIPIIVITVEDTLINRVAVAKLGGRGFLQKPLIPTQAIDAVTEVLQRTQCIEATLLVVDDDPVVLDSLQTILEPWGMNVVTLNDPHQFWETLEETAPDLLVLDVEMPLVSGIELCQVVRNDPRWHQLPVIFLTAYSDADTINRIFAVGADDYVCKPTIGPELVTRIFNRLERSQLLRSLAETDPLTKIANRHKSVRDLTRFLHLAHRQHQSLCFAILDLDHFKQVNDLYGHAIGDKVLCKFGEHLQRSFRREDVVARWGGEEFIVGMYGTSKSDGLKRLKELLDIWHKEQFTSINGTKFTVSFSAGIAQYPQDGSDLQELYHVADAALYLAKTQGRSRIVYT